MDAQRDQLSVSMSDGILIVSWPKDPQASTPVRIIVDEDSHSTAVGEDSHPPAVDEGSHSTVV